MTPILSGKALGRVKASSCGNPPRSPPVHNASTQFVEPQYRSQVTRDLVCPRLRPRLLTQRSPATSIKTCDGPCVRRGTPPQQSKALSGKRRRLSPYANYDPSLVVQDLNLPTPFALYLRHAKYLTPDSLEIGRQVTLTPQPRAISANEAELIIRHGLPRVRCYRTLKRMERTKVPRPRKMLGPAQRSQCRDEARPADAGFG